MIVANHESLVIYRLYSQLANFQIFLQKISGSVIFCFYQVQYCDTFKKSFIICAAKYIGTKDRNILHYTPDCQLPEKLILLGLGSNKKKYKKIS